MVLVFNGLNRIYAEKEIDLTFWDRVSPVQVIASGTGSSRAIARIGSFQAIEIAILDEFGNDVFPQTEIERCSHGSNTVSTTCSLVWNFDEDIAPLIGPLSKKLKFFMIALDTDGLLADRQAGQEAALDSFNVDISGKLLESPKLIPTFNIIGGQIVLKTDPLLSTADVLFRIGVNAIGLFAEVNYDVNVVLRDDNFPNVMVEKRFPGVAFVGEDETFDFTFTDPSVFALLKPKLDIRISINGNVISEILDIPLARVEFVEPEPEPEPLPPILEPEPIPEPEPEPIPIPQNNTLRNAGIVAAGLVAAALVVRR